MPIKFNRSDRPKYEVYFENMMLTICIMMFAPVAATVVGLALIIPLLMGLKNSLNDGNNRSIKGTTRAIQALLVLPIFFSNYMMFSAGNKLQSARNELYEYTENFPHKQTLEAYSDMSAVEMVTKYGVETFDYISRISIENHANTSRLKLKIDYAEQEFHRKQIPSAVLIAYLIVLQIGWSVPLQNKINAGEWRWKKGIADNKKGKVITVVEELSGYSVADELLKWDSLKEKGVVSEAQYRNARDRLLGEAS